jgi:hypothetical protein
MSAFGTKQTFRKSIYVLLVFTCCSIQQMSVMPCRGMIY